MTSKHDGNSRHARDEVILLNVKFGLVIHVIWYFCEIIIFFFVSCIWKETRGTWDDINLFNIKFELGSWNAKPWYDFLVLSWELNLLSL